MKQKHSNALIHESSPYLLQHAHNPVAWEAWGDEVLEKAGRENKLLLVSIGYAACHWCHVMEKECFEDEAVAAIMNRNFIPVKVDREERPDIDHIYMDALQLMTGGGGWPLNVVALPDGRPFWGATYVRKGDWMRVLEQLAELYKNDPVKVREYADNLAEGLHAINRVLPQKEAALMTSDELEQLVADWAGSFDTTLGGYTRAPKFMMPVHLEFFLHYATLSGNKQLMQHVNTTLTKMAYGGIFDHVGGGFSRYSTDMKWHVPHFEKMLYDNAQLISLYSKAYAATAIPLYREVAEKCLGFVQQELSAPGHGFYSSLDADSKNEAGRLEEGAFYVWRKEELECLLGDRLNVFADYYNINDYGLWEEGKYILIRDTRDEEVARNHGLSLAALRDLLVACRKILAKARSKRNRPRLDDKILASWNGLMLKALTDAFRHLGDAAYLKQALASARYLENIFIEEEGRVIHSQRGSQNHVPGFLEDYACLTDAFLGLYEVTFDATWLHTAQKLADFCMEQHFDPDSQLFFFSPGDQPTPVRQTLETSDNVIPSSNSIMAKNLLKLSGYFPTASYGATSRQMLLNMMENVQKHAQSHANWIQLLLYHLYPFYELAFLGPESSEQAAAVYRKYLPQTVLAGSKEASNLPLLKQRLVPDTSLIYVCREGSCQLPVSDVQQALQQLMPG